MSAKLAEFDDLARELTEEIERGRDSVNRECDKLVREKMIEHFGREVEEEFIQRTVERARDVAKRKLDEVEKEMIGRIEDARERARHQFSD